MKKKPDPVVHFEMGYNDEERMIRFYRDVFGWQAQKQGPDMGGYVVVQTTETDKKGMIKTPGNINGGFYQKIADPMSHAPSVVIAVEDIHASMKEVTKAGGKIAGARDEEGKASMEPMMIPGIGLWISIIDPEGNRVSMLQPERM